MNYLQEKLWLQDKYLITPYTSISLPTISATKICRLCKKKKFSGEFLNCDFFIDYKFPVCNDCYRKRKNNLSIAIINEYKLTKRCNKCNTSRLLGEFAHRKIYNDLYPICKQCNKNPLFDKN